MPVKNAERFLQECLDSILQQSFIDFELIAVNDNSTDKSLEILQYYALQDDRIKILNSNGNGIIDALRLAFQESNGEFVTRMDADDKMHPEKLSQMHKSLQDCGPGHLIVGLVEYFSEEGIGEGYKRYAKWLNSLTLKEENFSDIYRECVIPSPCWMLNRKDLIECDAFNPNRYPEDYDLCFRFYKNKLKVKAVDSILHFWRDYPERSSRTDPNYLDNRFFDIKLHYFLLLEYTELTDLILLGAGKKAKYIARHLQEENIEYSWYTNNPNKIGQEVYGVVQQNQNFLTNIEDSDLVSKQSSRIIIAVSNPEEQKDLEVKLQAKQLALGKQYFFFS